MTGSVADGGDAVDDKIIELEVGTGPQPGVFSMRVLRSVTGVGSQPGRSPSMSRSCWVSDRRSRRRC